jgi:hypothetical protein
LGERTDAEHQTEHKEKGTGHGSKLQLRWKTAFSGILTVIMTTPIGPPTFGGSHEQRLLP